MTDQARSRVIGNKPLNLEDVLDYISNASIERGTLAIDFNPLSTRNIHTNRVVEGQTSDTPALRPCKNSLRRMLHTVQHALTGSADMTSVLYALYAVVRIQTTCKMKTAYCMIVCASCHDITPPIQHRITHLFSA